MPHHTLGSQIEKQPVVDQDELRPRILQRCRVGNRPADSVNDFAVDQVDPHEGIVDNRRQLSTAVMRARYRESLREPTPVPAGKSTKYVFDNLTFFSRQLAKGSYVRLVVESLNSVALEKNYNSGGVVAQETGKDARTAHIQLLHDAEHASMVELPTVK